MNKFSAYLVLVIFIVAGCSDPSKPDKAASDSDNKFSKSLDLYLPNDLEATLWAESPLFFNPTNLDVDVKGRIWVTEAVNYRNFNNDSTKALHHVKGDRVMILEDLNNDGKADTSKVFVEDKDLIAPVGIAVIGNKVIVSCSPNLIVYTDEDGDDRPDKKEIFLTGFGGKDHDHSLHAVYAGPDGRWYFNAGNAGPHIVKDKSGWTLRAGSLYTGGSPYNTKNAGNQKSDDGKIWVGGIALRINPDGTGLKVMGHNFRNSYEVIPDSYGNLWQNDNDDQVVTCRTTWLMEGGNAGYFSTDGTRFWQADQRPGQDIFRAHWHQDDPGVMPAGDRSGAGAPTGVTVYEGDALGKNYQGLLLSADAGRNTIFGYHPSLKQSGYDLGKRENFISSLSDADAEYVWNDTAENKKHEKWFRPSDVTVGTDGAIYVADWYDPVVGGHQMQDSLGYGRIYRIVPKGKKLTAPKIDLNTIDGQIAALKSPAINVRNQGFERIKKQGESAVPTVKALLNDADPYIKARAIWLLAQLGQKGVQEVTQILSTGDELSRATAYRALRVTEKDILPLAEKAANDSSAFVRREVMVSLRDLPYEKTKPILLQLIKQFDGNDRWYLETFGADVKGHESDIYPQLVKMFGDGKTASQWNQQMSAIAWRLHPSSAINDLTDRAQDEKLSPADRDAAITALSFIDNKAAANSMVSLAKNKQQDVAEKASYWLSFRQSNDWFRLLDWSKISLNTGYERKLAQMKVKKSIVLDNHQSFYERKSQISEMSMDSVGGQMVIGMAEAKTLPKDLIQTVEGKIFNNPDATVRMQAGNYFKHEGADHVFSIQSIMKMSADPAKGKATFKTHCATCHKIGSEGNTIGPDLSGIGKKFDKPALLDAIVNPSAAIVFGYEPWLVNTSDGATIYGFLLSENKQAIVLKDIAGQKHTIDVKKITSKKKEDKSLMPDPVSNGLNEQDLANIAEYLTSESTASAH